ncbi:MAG: DUF2063 domain-containing protein [Burkholderiaceae bacterium]|nr:MAG: DUF2063 domain-containing protein [Burkholderiaceae bacterium]
MAATLSLLECQRQFLAALYDERVADAAQAIAGNGLAPEARLRIYRHSSEQTHVAALRTTYPAVLALVGAAFFEQTALGYRRANRSPSGNLQAFGAGFAAYLETLAALQAWPYLPDVARLEWLRQEAALAGDAERLSVDALDRALAAAGETARIPLRPGVRLLASRHAVLTIWRYAIQPTEARLALPPQGERVVLWRAGGEVAMAELDRASFACVAALATGETLAAACARARALDVGFDSTACLDSLAKNGLLSAVIAAHSTEAPCSKA